MVGLLVSGVGIPFGVRFALICYFISFWIWIWICLCFVFMCPQPVSICVLVSGVSRAGFRCFFSFTLVFSGLVARVCLLSFNLVLGLGKKDLFYS